MGAFEFFIGLVWVMLLAYLFIALMKPEWFE